MRCGHATCYFQFCFQVDEERLRVSLGMKNSYVQNDCGASGIVVNENVEYNKVAASVEYNNHIKGNLGSANDRFPESTTDSFHVFEQAEARASIPPLDVSLNDFEASDVENADTTERIVIANGNVEDSVKKRKRQKRKEKEERFFRFLIFFLLDQYFSFGKLWLIKENVCSQRNGNKSS